jgi:hypothetical protein
MTTAPKQTRASTHLLSPFLRLACIQKLQKRWPLFRATMDGVLELAREEIGERFNVGAVTASQLPVERLVDSSLFLWSVPLRLRMKQGAARRAN